MKMDATTLLLLAGGAAAVYYLVKNQAAATPLSIYPSLAWTSTTSTATTPRQKASTAIAPESLYTLNQAQNQSAMYSQCVGAYPGCTPLMSDTQLGF